MAFQLSIYTGGKFSPTQAIEDSKKLEDFLETGIRKAAINVA